MQTKVKRYYVIVRGRVQDTGYRKRIEGTAELFSLKGFPWNDIEIKEKLPSGIFVESLEKKEISIEFPLPSRFARLETEELAEISGKLDIGNERLKGIEANTQRMEANIQRVEANTGATMETLKSIDSKLDTLPERIAKAIK